MTTLKYHSCFIFFLCLCLPLILSNCSRKSESPEKEETITIVFKHGKIGGNPKYFEDLLKQFEAEHHGIKVKDEPLPSSTDEQHQFYVINLEGNSSDFDVLSMDVIWVQEFARSGWIRDLGHIVPSEQREAFFPGPMEAVTYNGRAYAVPWYIDAGLLYYRKDLLQKYGFDPPGTWEELVSTARSITSKEQDLYGFVWQGKQYEGLVCNVLEYFWSNGGEVLHEGKPVISSNENILALQFMKDLILKYNVSPELVTGATEEQTRHIFGNGKALFMRNWPYAWNIFQEEGSLVRDRVGITTLPAFAGRESASTLGGWQLGINRFSRHQEAAEKLIQFFCSPEIQKSMALSVGFKPTRKSLYQDKALLQEQPFLSSLYQVFLKAKPRPLTPYYLMLTQVMQPEFSAALTGIKTPEEALQSAREQMEHILSLETRDQKPGNGNERTEKR